MLSARIEKREGLTPRECRVLQLVAEGFNNEAIAGRLAISIKTVETHLDHVYEKLQVRSASVHRRCAAIATAVARRMVSVSVKSILIMVCVAGCYQESGAVRVRVPRPPVSARRLREEA